MIEDLVYRCNGCTAREVVRPVAAEMARLDGTLDTVLKEVPHTNFDPTPVPAPLWDQDRVRVKLPEGWDRRHGGNGRGFYHRCPDCVKKGISFA